MAEETTDSERYQELTAKDLDGDDDESVESLASDDEFCNVAPLVNVQTLHSMIFNTSFRRIRSSEPHSLLTEFLDGPWMKNAASADAFQLGTTHARRYVEAMSSITHYTAWVYCAEEDIEMGSSEVATLLSSVLQDELDPEAVDLAPFFGEKFKKATSRKSYWKKMILRITLMLGKGFAKPLMKTVGRSSALPKKCRS